MPTITLKVADQRPTSHVDGTHSRNVTSPVFSSTVNPYASYPRENASSDPSALSIAGFPLENVDVSILQGSTCGAGTSSNATASHPSDAFTASRVSRAPLSSSRSNGSDTARVLVLAVVVVVVIARRVPIATASLVLFPPAPAPRRVAERRADLATEVVVAVAVVVVVVVVARIDRRSPRARVSRSRRPIRPESARGRSEGHTNESRPVILPRRLRIQCVNAPSRWIGVSSPDAETTRATTRPRASIDARGTDARDVARVRVVVVVVVVVAFVRARGDAR